MSNVSTTTRELKGLLDNPMVQEKLKAVVGKNLGAFTTSVVQIASSNAMLATSEPNSILGAAMTAATLNLPLNNALGFAFIVPFRERQKDNSYITKAQFQISWKGYIRLAQRSNQFLRINAGVVKKGEIESRDRLTGDIEWNWEQNDKEREKLPSIGYFAYFKLLNGYEHTLFMRIDEIKAHGKKYSQTYKKGFGLWETDFDAMATKTVLKALLSKYAPLSSEMETAVEKDQASFNDIEDTEDISYVDNEDVKLDHNLERQKNLLDSELITQDDFIFAESNITDSEMRKELFQKLVEGASTPEDFKFAEDLIDDEVIKANLQVKKVAFQKAAEKKSKK